MSLNQIIDSLCTFNITELIPLIEVIEQDSKSNEDRKYFPCLLIIPKQQGIISTRNHISIENCSNENISNKKAITFEHYAVFQVQLSVCAEKESDDSLIFKYIKIKDIQIIRNSFYLENELIKLCNLSNSAARESSFLHHYKNKQSHDILLPNDVKNQSQPSSLYPKRDRISSFINQSIAVPNKEIQIIQQEEEIVVLNQEGISQFEGENNQQNKQEEKEERVALQQQSSTQSSSNETNKNEKLVHIIQNEIVLSDIYQTELKETLRNELIPLSARNAKSFEYLMNITQDAKKDLEQTICEQYDNKTKKQLKESSKQLRKNNNREKAKEQNNRILIELQIEASNHSVSKSAESRSSNEKNKIIKKIKSKTGIKKMIIFTMIGLLSYGLFLTLTFIGYQKNQDGLALFQPSFKMITRPIEMLFNTLDVARQVCFSNIMSSYFPKEDKAFIERQSKAAQAKAVSDFSDYQDDFTSLVLIYSNNDMIDFLNSQMIDVKVMTQIETSTSEEVQVLSSKSKSLLDLLKDYYIVSSQLVLSSNPSYQYFMWQNLPSLREKTSNFQNYIINEINKILYSNIYDYWVQLVATFLVTLLLLISFFIFKYFSILQNQNILSLMGSIKPELLQMEIHKANIFVEYLTNKISRKQGLNQKQQQQQQQYSNLKLDSYANLNGQLDENEEANRIFNVKQNSTKRKRSIAQFDKLPKLNAVHAIISVIVLTAFVFQASINLILVSPFVKEQDWLLQSKIAVLELIASLQEVTTPQLYIIQDIFQNENPTQSIYYNFLKDETTLIKDKKKYATFLQYPPTFKRHNDELYEGLYDTIINNNICEVMLKYPEFFRSNYTQSECSGMAEGILTKGLVQSMNHAQEQVSRLTEIYLGYDDAYTINDLDAIQKQIQDMQYLERSVSELNDLVKAIENAVIALNIYYYKVTADYTYSIDHILYFLFLYQLLFITIAMFIGWNKLFSSINHEMIQTKQSLALFHVDILLESAVIKKYFQSNDFGVN